MSCSTSWATAPPRCSMGLRSGLCEGHLSSSTSNSSNHAFMDLAVSLGYSHSETEKGFSPNCSHKVGSLELAILSWYAKELRFPLTGTKPSGTFSWHSPNTFIRLVRWLLYKETWLLISTAAENSGGMLSTTPSRAWHCVWRCQASSHRNQHSEAPRAQLLCWF